MSNWNPADVKAALAEAGMTMEILSPDQYASAVQAEAQGYCWPTLGEPCGQCHRCSGARG